MPNNPFDIFNWQAKEDLSSYGLTNLTDFGWRIQDRELGRWHNPDPAEQFDDVTTYGYCLNNPVVQTDPDGRIVFAIPQISWSKKGGLSLGLELGIGVPGLLSASVTGGINTKSGKGYWSVQGYAGGFYAGYGSQGGFAGYGYRYAGFSAGISYGTEGLGAGVSYGGTKNNYNGALGLGWSQKGGFDVNISGGYTQIFEKPTITQIAEYNLKGAPENAMQQKGGFDCLICASTYIDQMTQNRSYEQKSSEFGELYNPEEGTSTRAALEKIYTTKKIDTFPEFSPYREGTQMNGYR